MSHAIMRKKRRKNKSKQEKLLRKNLKMKGVN